MRILEMQEYAQGDKFNSLEFEVTDSLSGKKTKGHWVEAYFVYFG